MKLSEVFEASGFGVLSTSAPDGQVNSAVYARPHVVDDSTLVWGMTDKHTFQNVSRNRHAAFLFKSDGPGFRGVRLSLELIRTEEEGEMLAAIRKNTAEIVGPGAGASVTHAAWFRVTELRPLV